MEITQEPEERGLSSFKPLGLAELSTNEALSVILAKVDEGYITDADVVKLFVGLDKLGKLAAGMKKNNSIHSCLMQGTKILTGNTVLGKRIEYKTVKTTYKYKNPIAKFEEKVKAIIKEYDTLSPIEKFAKADKEITVNINTLYEQLNLAMEELYAYQGETITISPAIKLESEGFKIS